MFSKKKLLASLLLVLIISVFIVVEPYLLHTKQNQSTIAPQSTQRTINNVSATPTTSVSDYEACGLAGYENYIIEIPEDGWIELKSDKLNLSFEYPLHKKDAVGFRYQEFDCKTTDPIGTSFDWELKSNDVTLAINKPIAQGFSKDHLLGRDEIKKPYKWINKNGSYYIVESVPGETIKDTPITFTDREIAANKLEVFNTNFGTQGLLYEHVDCTLIPEESCSGKLRDLIVSLPIRNNTKIQSIIFSIDENMQYSDINRIVKSIKVFD